MLQDIGADGFEVEPPVGESPGEQGTSPWDEDILPNDGFAAAGLDMTPGTDGAEHALVTADPGRPSRVRRLDEDETPLDRRYGDDGMGGSAELSELPPGSEQTMAGELGRYECPNCGFQHDVVVGATARCAACRHRTHLARIIGDRAFHESVAATEIPRT